MPDRSHSRRLAQVQKSFAAKGIDGFFVTAKENVTYLSGFNNDESFLFITRRARYFLTDSRYVEEARKEAVGFSIVLRGSQSYPEMLRALADKEKCARIGFEASKVSHAFYISMCKALGTARLVPVHCLVEKLRAKKEPLEIRHIRKAVEITAAGVRHLAATLAPGMTEKEIQARLEYQTKMLGSEKPAFDIIIAAGAKSSMPHAVSDDRSVVRDEDMVLVDMGVVSGGYHSDLTRCFFLGKIPPFKRKIYDIVLQAQERGIRRIKPGIAVREIDAACRGYIEKRGYGRLFGHGTGHGVGLEIHEAPTVSGKSSEVLEPGMVVTVEPGIYLPGRFGVRIEDMVLVTDKGHEVLTRDIDKRI